MICDLGFLTLRTTCECSFHRLHRCCHRRATISLFICTHDGVELPLQTGHHYLSLTNYDGRSVIYFHMFSFRQILRNDVVGVLKRKFA